MTGPRLSCAEVDELAGAIALGAMDGGELRAVDEHLAGCPEPHDAVRSLLGAGPLLSASLEPVAPSVGLRDRLMASAAATPQEHVPGHVVPDAEPPRVGRGWLDWLTPGLARGLAAAAVVVAVALGGWNVALQAEIAAQQRITTALAGARAIYPVTGEAGRGLLLDTPDGPRFLATALDAPPSGSIYQLWLVGEDGVPVDAGIAAGADRLDLVPVEEGLVGFATFAVTVEASRVEAPSSSPVLVADLSDPAGS